MKRALKVSSLLVVLGMAGQAGGAAAPHAGITGYDGPKSCAPCHPDAAREVTASLHYQQLAEPKFLAKWEKGMPAGMMKSY